MGISVCILINQWHPRLMETLKSYSDCCDEILLGMNGRFKESKHPELKDIPNLRCISLDWEGYGATRNTLASHAKNDWILSVDYDEVANYDLQKELRQISFNYINKVYAVKMIHFLGEKAIKHGSWSTHRKRFLRLYNKTYTQWNLSEVHEEIIRKPDTRIIPLSGRILHYTSENYKQFLVKNRNYAKLAAQKYFLEGKKGSEWKKRLNPLYRFFWEYIIQLGFLDGYKGYQIARGNAFYTFYKYDYLQKLQKEAKSK